MRNLDKTRVLSALLLAAPLSALAQPTEPQDQPEAEDAPQFAEEVTVTVTARKCEENVQAMPFSVAAPSGQRHVSQKESGSPAHVLANRDADSNYLADLGVRRGGGHGILQQGGGVAVRIVHLLQASLGELGAVLLEHAPRPGAGRAVQAAAAADPRDAQVLVQARHAVGLHDLLPHVVVEAIGKVQVGRLEVQRPLPRSVIAAEDDAELVAPAAQETHHPAVQVRDVDAGQLLRLADPGCDRCRRPGSW